VLIAKTSQLTFCSTLTSPSCIYNTVAREI
jgi:hypothetical protein